MPGVFGLILPAGDPRGDGVCERLARDMVLFPWQSARLFGDGDGPRLGVVVNGSTDEDLAPFAHRADDLTCVFEGVLTRALEDCGAGAPIAAGRHAEAAVAAYRRFGEDFASRLEGQFNVIVHDAAAGRLIVATDRNNLCPLFHHRDGRAQLFCSLLGPMAACGLFAPRFDSEGVATVLAHAHVFADQGLLAGVRPVDGATVHVIDTASRDDSVRRYWHYGFAGGRDPRQTFASGVDDVCDVLTAAAERDAGRSGAPYASLSGGMDSRLVTGLAVKHRPDLQAWTFGHADAPDLDIAARICRATGMRHHVFRTSLECIVEHAEDFVSATNCSAMVNHAFAFERAHALRGQAGFNHNGYRGGVLLGDAIVDKGLKSIIEYRLARLRGRATGGSPWLEDCRDDAEVIAYYEGICHHPDDLTNSILTRRAPRMRDMMAPILSGQLADVPVEYKLEQWAEEYGGGRHMSLLGIVGDRPFFGDASLFYDYDVRDRCFALAPRHRRGRKAYIAVLKRLLPDLAKLDYANTLMPADTPPWRVSATKLLRRLRGRGTRISTGLDVAASCRLPALRDFYGDILRGDAARGRDFWNHDRLIETFDAHQAGRVNAAGIIHAAVTVELFARRWVDGNGGVG